METLNPKEFILQSLKSGLRMAAIKKQFIIKFPSIPITELPNFYNEAVREYNTEAKKKFEDDKELGLSKLPNELVNTIAESELLYLDVTGERDSQGRPHFALLRKFFIGKEMNCLYKGYEPKEALKIAIKVTKCAKEERRIIEQRLLEGYNIMPGFDGKYIMLGLANEELCEGSLEECYKAMEIHDKQPIKYSTLRKINKANRKLR